MSGGGLWNDCGACELEYHDTLLLACQKHRTVSYFSSKMTFKRSRRIFSQYASLLAQLVSVPFALASRRLLKDLNRVPAMSYLPKMRHWQVNGRPLPRSACWLTAWDPSDVDTKSMEISSQQVSRCKWDGE